MTIIHIKHARAIIGPNGKGYCSRGMRLFAERHQLNWEEFVLHGIDVKTVAHIDDEMLKAVIREAEEDGQG